MGFIDEGVIGQMRGEHIGFMSRLLVHKALT